VTFTFQGPCKNWEIPMESDNLKLAEMTRRLVDEFQPEQVILFGSRAWGTPTPDSDVDLLVIVSESESPEYERIVRARRRLSEFDIPKDLIVRTRAEFERYSAVRGSLEHQIAEQGRVLYERGPESARVGLAAQSRA
jgi:predicted nucleotidyltransferase